MIRECLKRRGGEKGEDEGTYFAPFVGLSSSLSAGANIALLPFWLPASLCFGFVKSPFGKPKGEEKARRRKDKEWSVAICLPPPSLSSAEAKPLGGRGGGGRRTGGRGGPRFKRRLLSFSPPSSLSPLPLSLLSLLRPPLSRPFLSLLCAANEKLFSSVGGYPLVPIVSLLLDGFF